MSRGVHRGVYGALFDDPDYQALSAPARLVLLTVRLCAQAGPAAIFRYYPELLARQTGLSVKQIGAALHELSDRLWIVYDEAIVWVKNGLRHDPTMRLNNSKHLSAVNRAVESLPHHAIVLEFCNYYQLRKPFDSLSKAGDKLDGADVRIPKLPDTTETTRNYPKLPEKDTTARAATPPRPAPPQGSGVQQVLDAYQLAFMAANGGEKPNLTGKDAALAKQLVTRHGADKVLAVVAALFDSQDPFIAQSGRTLGVLSACWNKLVTAPAITLTPKTQGNLEAARRFIDRGGKG